MEPVAASLACIAARTGTFRDVYYGTGDYTPSNGNWIPAPTSLGASYGQLKYSINAAGQETFYGYNAAGENVLKYTYEQWTGVGDVIDYGWVGTTSVYDSAERLTDTYNTDRD